MKKLARHSYTLAAYGFVLLATFGLLLFSYSFSHPKNIIPGFAALQGDCNGDSKVDILDFQLLSNSFGKTSTQSGYNAKCDFNSDLKVDILDFQVLSNNFGGSGSPTVTPTPIPPFVVTLTSPTNGGTYSGTLNAAATVTANTTGEPIQGVIFILDGTSVATDTTSPYSIAINLLKYVNGQHSIIAQAYTYQYDAMSAKVTFNITGSISPTITPTRSITPTPLPTGTGVSCSSLSGIEKKFPCSPLRLGNMPGDVTSGADSWDMFSNMLYQGIPNIGDPPHFEAVANPVGSGVVVRNLNLLSDSEKHTTVGTSRDLPLGSTECSAFRWLWLSPAEFPQKGWALIWQLQMSGSPIVAIETDPSTRHWFFRSRNGSDTGLEHDLGAIQFGHWAYFAVCTHLADYPNGTTKIWYKSDGWPDVNAAPNFSRANYDSYQGTTGHNTIGIYAAHDGSSTRYYGYFDRYGRAVNPARAIQIAGNP